MFSLIEFCLIKWQVFSLSDLKCSILFERGFRPTQLSVIASGLSQPIPCLARHPNLALIELPNLRIVEWTTGYFECKGMR